MRWTLTIKLIADNVKGNIVYEKIVLGLPVLFD